MIVQLMLFLFISRNKDNKHITGFSERRESFITKWSWDDKRLILKFKAFCECGMYGEVCRYYYSVNSRDSEQIRRELMKFLIDSPEFNLCAIESKLAGIAATSVCATEKKWLFDFDVDSFECVSEFVTDIIKNSNLTENDIKTYKTPNGFAIIVNHGFDTRGIMNKWGDKVGLKRDDLLLVMWHSENKFNSTSIENADIINKEIVEKYG